MFTQYRIYIYAGILFLAFLLGVYVTRAHYENILKDQQIQLEKAKNELQVALENVRVEYVTKIKYIQAKGEDRVTVIDHYIPAEFVSNGFIEFHNAAAEGRSVKAMSDDEAKVLSTKTLREVAEVFNSNYTSCNKYIEQVNGLQNSLDEYNKIYGNLK